MPNKKVKPIDLPSPEEFKRLIDALWDELYWGKYYYDMFTEVNRLCGEHEKAAKRSPYFWHFTQKALGQTALVYLHRVYDQNPSSFNLHRFLVTVRANHKIFDPVAVRERRKLDPAADSLISAIGSLNPADLERDIELASDDDPKVKNLNKWRNEVHSHTGARRLWSKQPFEQQNPLPYSDIEELFDRGFKMLNRYSEYFDTTFRTKGFKEWKDMKFVFDAIQKHLGPGPTKPEES
jgi:hypothetical protein